VEKKRYAFMLNKVYDSCFREIYMTVAPRRFRRYSGVKNLGVQGSDVIVMDLVSEAFGYREIE
jgi:hypothetical protein